MARKQAVNLNSHMDTLHRRDENDLRVTLEPREQNFQARLAVAEFPYDSGKSGLFGHWQTIVCQTYTIDMGTSFSFLPP